MRKILLVDDDSALLLILEHALTARGYEVNTLLEPEKAIETMDRMKPDILILDINANGANGYDICEQIKGIPMYNKLPVILFYAQSRLGSFLSKCEEIAIIQKPVSTSLFISKIEAVIADLKRQNPVRR